MSKSVVNTVDPNKVMQEYVYDNIRQIALSVDNTEDHRIGPEILKGVADQYRKLRNTFRYLLGALDGFDERERVGVEAMPELERYVLALLDELDRKLRQAVEDFDFNSYTRALIDFCNEDLSAFYFDIRKDSLYCDAPDDARRRACRTVLDTLFHALIRYAAPVMVFTSEEVWASRYPDMGSVHLLEWPKVPAIPFGPHLTERYAAIRRARDAVTAEIEPMRREKQIRSSLEAVVKYPFDGLGLTADQFAELCIVSEARNSEKAEILISEQSKCGRCWRLLPEVTEDGGLCDRCEGVVARMDAGA
jgi:isoleucyl-tRNA synthetase